MNLEKLIKKIRSSRILTFAVPAVMVLGIAAIYEYGYLPVQETVSASREAEAVKSKTLEKYVTLIAQKPDFEKQLALLKELRKAEDRKIIEGRTPSLAAAAIQNTVKSLITGKAGTISSERVDKPESLGKFSVISVSLDAVLPDARALSDVLYAIETQTPYLAVKELDARVQNFNNPRELTVRLKVVALTAGK
jgi:hypothetical protein